MVRFQKPKKLDYDPETLPRTTGVHRQPFERGFGTTIGTRCGASAPRSREQHHRRRVEACSRVLVLQGVVEDMTDVVLNLKQVLSVCTVPVPRPLLEKKGRVVTAADFEEDPTSRSRCHGAHRHLSKEGSLKLEARLKKGRGYVSPT